MGATIYLTDNDGVTWLLGVLSGETQSNSSIPTGSQLVTPVSMSPNGFTIATGVQLLIDYGNPRFEAVTVTTYTPGTNFTATFSVNHNVTPVPIIVGGAIQVTAQNVLPPTPFIGTPIGGFPKIIWPSGGINVVQFTWPNKDVSYYVHKSERADDYSTYGIHVAVVQRIDHFLEFRMPVIILGNDAVQWSTYLDYAATGGNFDYYPDSTLSSFTTYHLDATEMKMEYNAPGVYEIKGVRFRQVIV